MRMFLRKTRLERDPLTVTMSGVRLGERALQIGAGNAHAIALIAAKTGLTGTAAIVVRDNDEAGRVRRAITDLGALVDLRVAADANLPFDDAAFDAIVIHDARMVETDATGEGAQRLRECHRVLRHGGRLVIVGAGTPVGFRALLGSLSGGGRDAGPDQVVSMLTRAGFSSGRILGDREGLRFVEGLKAQ